MPSLTNELQVLFRESRVKHIGLLITINFLCCLILLTWCTSTQSLALRAYTYTVWFNILSLLTCLLSIWVEKQKPTSIFTFGYERFEVVAIFSCTVLAQLASLFITKEGLERLLDQPEIHTGRLLMGTGIALLSHLLVIYGSSNSALDHIIATASSSWLQDQFTDISQSLCSIIPALSGVLLPRVNPMLLIAFAGAGALFLTNFLVEMKNYHLMDSLAAMAIASMTCATLFPMSVYSGKVLLQTTPLHVIGQLDKCLRETLTVDGVLEFRNEHFWTLSFGKLAGSLHVRIRREADEQLVLAQVVTCLSRLVPVLTVQVFKDDWSRGMPVVSIPPLTSPSLHHANSVFVKMGASSGPSGNGRDFQTLGPTSNSAVVESPMFRPMRMNTFLPAPENSVPMSANSVALETNVRTLEDKSNGHHDR
ncbi:zinc transporter 6-like [Ischnura elegans]|uniref:zinc transporter 6-like n=1 Tax=Ischnura elegans TaxID=197161 RepID=UPI001ED891AA|nr:zinc transporter 6-like [Ischnura elegans]